MNFNVVLSMVLANLLVKLVPLSVHIQCFPGKYNRIQMVTMVGVSYDSTKAEIFRC